MERLERELGVSGPLAQVLVRRGLAEPASARAFLAAAEKIAGLPGLVWKLWAYDDAAHVAESVYLFDTEAQARAWGDGPMKPALGSHPGIGDIEVRY